VAAAPAPAEFCAACHGVGGVSEMENVPSLAAQPEAFLKFQINLFRERIRTVEPMTTAAEGLTDADVAALARYYAALPPPPPAVADPERARRGQALSAELRCGVCHGNDYAGRNQMPRLAAQREDYLLHAMRDYQAGTRQGAGAQMQAILSGITDQELADLAHFFATVQAPR
jgi:cytochrome c553